MSRHTILTEGETWQTGIYISFGSITWDDKVFLTSGTSNGRDVLPTIGTISEIRREDAKITAEVTLRYTNQDIDTDIMEFAPYISGIEFDSENKRVVTKAKLRGVYIQPAHPAHHPKTEKPNDSD